MTNSGGNHPGVCPAIVGPTAVGKTALITALAARAPIEIISLDSRQIYHGLRIGTAQPTAEEQALCRHHLIDFVSPEEAYSAARFRRDFEVAYTDITERGTQPVLVGGAGMYLTAVQQGFMEIPAAAQERLPEIRARLDGLDDQQIRAELQRCDSASFERIHPNDRYRSQRAVEIFELTGRSMTELSAAQRSDPALGLRFPVFVLTRPVAELDERIARRTELMLASGWLEETRGALEMHPANCPGLQSIGYRQIVAHLQGQLAADQLAADIVTVTRQYAKRQRTWFRNIEATASSHPDDPYMVEQILQACT